MVNALIGHTGFIGSHLLRQASFGALYNSNNIESIRGQRFDLVVCAGAPADKWRANQNPEADKTNLEHLMDCLKDVSARRLILISTIEVYPDPWKVDEESNVNSEKATPYGRHRWQLERFVAEHFDRCIVRLPELFGLGLKSNAIFDLIHRNQLQKLHADSQFQFYPINHLWDDLKKVITYSMKVINIATEPVTLSEVSSDVFRTPFENRPAVIPAYYDVQSQYVQHWNGSNGYLYNKSAIFDELKAFVDAERRAQKQ
ncbi:MAG: NAD-dependent epimerase/dehydratase family protein [Elusimicrobiota bacterium]|jgi:nucleoside-diphosphate-sugar epimerase